MEDILEIMKNVISGQCANSFIRIQLRYTAIFLGRRWVPKGWSGLQFGFFAPAHNPDIGYRCIAFYGSFLPGLSGSVGRWPQWYRWMKKQMKYRFILRRGFV